MSYGIVYKITNNLDGKIYVGQTTRSIEIRWNEHKRDAPRRKTHFYRALQKYGPDNFLLEILCDCQNQEELDKKEIMFVKKLKSLSPNGYNHAAGNGTGHVSEETKQKMSVAHKGKPKSEEHRGAIRQSLLGKTHSLERKRKNSESHKGKHLSNETKRKISKTVTGKKHSKETKRKISNSHKGKKASSKTKEKLSLAKSKTYFLVSPEGEKITVSNLFQFCKSLNLNHSSMYCVTGGHWKQYKGWKKDNEKC